jgi:dihydrofolate reductase
VHASFEADTFFPEIDSSKWKILSEIFCQKDEKNKYDCTFYEMQKIG